MYMSVFMYLGVDRIFFAGWAQFPVLVLMQVA